MAYHSRSYWARLLLPKISSLSQNRQNWRYEFPLQIIIWRVRRFSSWTFTKVRTSRGTPRYLAKTQTRRIAGTSTRALIWGGRIPVQARFGLQRTTVLWQAKTFGPAKRFSLVSATQFSNISESPYLNSSSADLTMGHFGETVMQRYALDSICFPCSRSRWTCLRISLPTR